MKVTKKTTAFLEELPDILKRIFVGIGRAKKPCKVRGKCELRVCVYLYNELD